MGGWNYTMANKGITIHLNLTEAEKVKIDDDEGTWTY